MAGYKITEKMKKLIYLIAFLITFMAFGQTTVHKRDVKVSGIVELTVPDSVLTMDAVRGMRWTKLTDVATKLNPLLNTGVLVSLDEGNGIGFVRKGRDPLKFGNVGLRAWDFSVNEAAYPASAVRGATGEASVIFGDDNIGSGFGAFGNGFELNLSNTYSTGFGRALIVSGDSSLSSGIDNVVSGAYSFSSGVANQVSGFQSAGLGIGLFSKNSGSVWVGQANLDYSPTAGINQADHIMFGVGNGAILAGTPNTVDVRRDAFKVFYTGNSVFGNIATATSVLNVYENTTGTGVNNGFTIENAGIGDALHHFKVAATDWTTGIDNNDSDKFKISSGLDLETNIRLTITTDGKFGINTSSPEKALHIYESGISPAYLGSDKFIIQRNGATGDFVSMAIIGGATGGSIINFGDVEQGDIGKIFYDHSNDLFDFNITDTTRMTIKVGGININGVVRPKGYTVSTLPTGTQGDMAFVTDATTPTYLGALTGSGAVVTPVFFNGTIWVSH